MFVLDGDRHSNMITLINSYYFHMLWAWVFVSLYESVWQYMNVNVKFITLNFNGLQLKPCSTENSGTKKQLLADSPCSMDDISFGEFLSLDLWTE